MTAVQADHPWGLRFRAGQRLLFTWRPMLPQDELEAAAARIRRRLGLATPPSP